jgi:hypothetical protein
VERWTVVKILDVAELAEFCAELVKLGIVFNAKKNGDGYWHVELTGY